ncbi:MAG: polyhydroxyalkanoic acid system family protein [Myxococcales bacterium]|nr:polyhydroxyalkanoic acid system family protein [Myxococcales bacterium]MCB9749867.1 polyhydroxyalkanoic acid system family protein [Myxococcales bacterium]
MAAIELSRKHNLSPEVIRERLDGMRAKLKDKFNIDSSWASDNKASVSGNGLTKGLNGTVEFSDTDINVALDLPWKLKLMKGQIASALEGELDKVISSGEAAT